MPTFFRSKGYLVFGGRTHFGGNQCRINHTSRQLYKTGNGLYILRIPILRYHSYICYVCMYICEEKKIGYAMTSVHGLLIVLIEKPRSTRKHTWIQIQLSVVVTRDKYFLSHHSVLISFSLFFLLWKLRYMYVFFNSDLFAFIWMRSPLLKRGEEGNQIPIDFRNARQNLLSARVATSMFNGKNRSGICCWQTSRFELKMWSVPSNRVIHIISHIIRILFL